MTDENKSAVPQEQEKLACDQSISRKEFLATVIKRATIAGALMMAPQVVDKFLVPPVYAHNSTSHFHDTSPSSDTSPFHDHGTNPFQDHGTGTLQDHGTSPFHDQGTGVFADHGGGGGTGPFADHGGGGGTGAFADHGGGHGGGGGGTNPFFDSGDRSNRFNRGGTVNDNDYVGDDWG